MAEIAGKFFDDTTPELSESEASVTYEPLPLGKHTFVVIKAEDKANSDGSIRIAMQIKIVESEDPNDVGKKGWDTLFKPRDDAPSDHFSRKLFKRLYGVCPDAFRSVPDGRQFLKPAALVGLVYKGEVIEKEQGDRKFRNVLGQYPIKMAEGEKAPALSEFTEPAR